MRPAGSRCRFPLVVAVILAALLAASISVIALMARPALPAKAVTAPLGIDIDRTLSLIGEPLALTIKGETAESLIGCRLVVRVKGPAELSQIGQVAPELPEADKVVITLDSPVPATTTTMAGPGGETTTGEATGVIETTTTTVPATTTTTVAAKIGTYSALQAGVLDAEVIIPQSMPVRAGAYLIVVEVKAGTDVVADGQVWIGKAEPRENPVDLAFVWPVSLGIHRDVDGIFYDQVLEEAVAPASDGVGDLRALLGLSGRFTDWDYTLAVEPVFLTQLRDMADGYSRSDISGAVNDLTAEDPAAKNAAAVLTAFKGLGGDASVQIVVGPYSGADLGVLAAEGWRDGFEQIQMGKQEIQQTMGLESPLIGGYSPDLNLTTDSLGFYAEASIDHVVVDAGLAALLTEPVAEGTVAVRARDANNDRVTLVFASSALSSHMTASWNPELFPAALAAELASGTKEAVVISPKVEFSLVPEAYLDGIGEILAGTAWIRTSTLTRLLREHAPDTRPIMLKTGVDETYGYIKESLLAALRTAHTVVTDLAAVADTTRIPVEAAHRLLYMAQSRWWSRPDTSPREATIGQQYAKQAQALAQAELDKIHLVGVDSTRIVGNSGIVTLTAQNDTGYPVNVELRLEGSGLTLPDGKLVEIELPGGPTEIRVRVENAEGSHTLEAAMMAGQSPLDQSSYSLRFFTIMTVLPWIVVAAVVIAGALFLLVRWLLHKRRPTQAA